LDCYQLKEGGEVSMNHQNFKTVQNSKYDIFKKKIRRRFLGMNFTDGLLYKVVVYLLLISFTYIYLYPLIFMIVNSLKNIDDLIDPGVKWIPKTLYFENYVRALEVLNMPKAMWDATIYVLKVAVVTTFTSAVVGYGFAKFKFPLRKMLFIFMLISFILPPQVLMVSNIIIYKDLGILSTEAAMILPALLGQGINSAIYILIFFQFFKTIPVVLDESAELDGASPIRIFRSISMPLAKPSMIIVFLFSFVWTWNETFMTGLYVGKSITLPLKLSSFVNSYITLFPPGTPGAELNEAIKLAGNVITIMPLLLLYFIFQRHFTESIDRTGITGE
jgi:multiple sugar transport system permease protein